MPKQEKHGKSKTSFSEAVKDALKDVNGAATFTVVELHGDVSPNPGTINFAVRLDVST